LLSHCQKVRLAKQLTREVYQPLAIGICEQYHALIIDRSAEELKQTHVLS